MREKWITNRRRAASRLPRLVRWLHEVSGLVNGAKFNLDEWGKWARGKPPCSVKEASECSFEGCSAGWAALYRPFRKAGLDLSEMGECIFEDEYGLSALASFFGVSFLAAFCLFGGSNQDWKRGEPKVASPESIELIKRHDPIAAAGRIERFCRDNGIEV